MIDLDYGTKSHEGIAGAYAELSRAAFAVWIRLMIMTDDELSRGREHLSRELGYSEPGASLVLKELIRKGYIRMQSDGPFQPSKLILDKSLLLKGDDRIIKLG